RFFDGRGCWLFDWRGPGYFFLHLRRGWLFGLRWRRLRRWNYHRGYAQTARCVYCWTNLTCGHVIDHPEDQGENQCRESRNSAVSPLRRCRGLRDGRQGMKVRQCPRVEDEQDSVHIAKTLVVFVNKLTLGAPFHADLLRFAGCDGACGCWSRSECAPQGSRVHRKG